MSSEPISHQKRHSDFESNNSSTIASDCSNSEDDLPCVSFTEKNWSGKLFVDTELRLK